MTTTARRMSAPTNLKTFTSPPPVAKSAEELGDSPAFECVENSLRSQSFTTRRSPFAVRRELPEFAEVPEGEASEYEQEAEEEEEEDEDEDEGEAEEEEAEQEAEQPAEEDGAPRRGTRKRSSPVRLQASHKRQVVDTSTSAEIAEIARVSARPPVRLLADCR